MKSLSIFTNLPTSYLPRDLVNRLVPVLAKCVKNFPEKFVCIILGDCQLYFNSVSPRPGAVATLETIGTLTPGDSKVIENSVAEFLKNSLGIPKDRFSLSFNTLGNNENCKADYIFDLVVRTDQSENTSEAAQSLNPDHIEDQSE